MDFRLEYDRILNVFNEELDRTLNINLNYEKGILEAISYSLLNGGKRLRPILLLKTCDLFNQNYKEGIPYAIAIEMIHTYSLIHDDLPAMDDDKFRRGKLSNHMVYGEASAILAGDGLLNLAYEILSKDIINSFHNNISLENRLKAMGEISKYSGIQGMIGGQVIDLAGSNIIKDENILKYMYKKKTSALIEASIVAGALLGKATCEEVEISRRIGENLGLAFQIRDDILDEEEDRKSNKITYLTYKTREEAEDLIEVLSNKAKEDLSQLNRVDSTFLNRLITELIMRKE